jgi:hypothetical protein
MEMNSSNGHRGIVEAVRMEKRKKDGASFVTIIEEWMKVNIRVKDIFLSCYCSVAFH